MQTISYLVIGFVLFLYELQTIQQRFSSFLYGNENTLAYLPLSNRSLFLLSFLLAVFIENMSLLLVLFIVFAKASLIKIREAVSVILAFSLASVFLTGGFQIKLDFIILALAFLILFSAMSRSQYLHQLSELCIHVAILLFAIILLEKAVSDLVTPHLSVTNAFHGPANILNNTAAGNFYGLANADPHGCLLAMINELPKDANSNILLYFSIGINLSTLSWTLLASLRASTTGRQIFLLHWIISLLSALVLILASFLIPLWKVEALLPDRHKLFIIYNGLFHLLQMVSLLATHYWLLPGLHELFPLNPYPFGKREYEILTRNCSSGKEIPLLPTDFFSCIRGRLVEIITQVRRLLMESIKDTDRSRFLLSKPSQQSGELLSICHRMTLTILNYEKNSPNLKKNSAEQVRYRKISHEYLEILKDLMISLNINIQIADEIAYMKEDRKEISQISDDLYSIFQDVDALLEAIVEESRKNYFSIRSIYAGQYQIDRKMKQIRLAHHDYLINSDHYRRNKINASKLFNLMDQLVRYIVDIAECFSDEDAD